MHSLQKLVLQLMPCLQQRLLSTEFSLFARNDRFGHYEEQRNRCNTFEWHHFRPSNYSPKFHYKIGGIVKNINCNIVHRCVSDVHRQQCRPVAYLLVTNCVKIEAPVQIAEELQTQHTGVMSIIIVLFLLHGLQCLNNAPCMRMYSHPLIIVRTSTPAAGPDEHDETTDRTITRRILIATSSIDSYTMKSDTATAAYV